LLATIPAAYPLRAVIHAAGTLDDGVLSAQTAERIDYVFAPKIDAALHLHELTAEHELAAFVLFSSPSGVLGGMGQSNYAAANTFLDALAAERRAAALPATALAWGHWKQRSNMMAQLSDKDFERMASLGIGTLSTNEALALFDAAISQAEPALLPMRLELGALRAQAAIPPLLRALIKPPAQRAAAARGLASAGLRERLANTRDSERHALVLELVRGEVASVLRLSRPSDAAPHRPLQELGLDSLTALELRNRLGAAADLRLPATLLFEQPTPHALATFLIEELTPAPELIDPGKLFAELQRIADALAELHANEPLRAQASGVLQNLLARLSPGEAAADGGETWVENVAEADDDELFRMLDRKLKTRGVADESE
jgi:acyl carrier protein